MRRPARHAVGPLALRHLCERAPTGSRDVQGAAGLCPDRAEVFPRSTRRAAATSSGVGSAPATHEAAMAAASSRSTRTVDPVCALMTDSHPRPATSPRSYGRPATPRPCQPHWLNAPTYQDASSTTNLHTALAHGLDVSAVTDSPHRLVTTARSFQQLMADLRHARRHGRRELGKARPPPLAIRHVTLTEGHM